MIKLFLFCHRIGMFEYDGNDYFKFLNPLKTILILLQHAFPIDPSPSILVFNKLK